MANEISIAPATMINRVAIVDTETTGLDPEKDKIIEIGVILYSVPDACPVSSVATLIPRDENPCEEINRIPAAATRRADSCLRLWEVACGMMGGADAILAHNAEFDRAFVAGVDVVTPPWICTKHDIEWPRQRKPGESLVSIALAHDVGVVCAHRALADCDLIARLLTRCHELGHDLQALLARGLRPKATFRALVSYDDREQAKAAGFGWEPGTKRWLRRMAVEDAAALPFATERVD